MTYCVGILVREGLVMVADTRTNAGLDNIATFRKLHLFEKPGEVVMTMATAGNLAVSQSVLTMVSEGMEDPDTQKVETLTDMPSMFKAAQFVGRAIREVHRSVGQQLEQAVPASFDVSMLLGGQVKGGRLRLFMIYAAGNFIEATEDTPFLQIGEHKYGKPILDRAVTYDTSLVDGVKLVLISMDSTLRSNLTVGMPVDLLVYRENTLGVTLRKRLTEEEPYFRLVREGWSNSLRDAYRAMQTPDWVPG